MHEIDKILHLTRDLHSVATTVLEIKLTKGICDDLCHRISNVAQTIDESLQKIKHDTNKCSNIPRVEYAHKRMCIEKKRKLRIEDAAVTET